MKPMKSLLDRFRAAPGYVICRRPASNDLGVVFEVVEPATLPALRGLQNQRPLDLVPGDLVLAHGFTIALIVEDQLTFVVTMSSVFGAAPAAMAEAIHAPAPGTFVGFSVFGEREQYPDMSWRRGGSADEVLGPPQAEEPAPAEEPAKAKAKAKAPKATPGEPPPADDGGLGL